MSHVLIIFQSNTEPIERLALAVAVGAVEAEGLIRLRRLAAPGAPEVGHQSYGTIKRADLEWAQTIVVGLEHAEPVADELGPLLELLSEGGLSGKRGWVFTEAGPAGEPTAAQTLVEGALQEAGILVGLPVALGEPGDLLSDTMKALGRLSGA
jgi:hypothetical protein